MTWQVQVLALLLGLVGPQRLVFLCSETELSHLVMAEAVWQPLQGHLCPVHPSIKCCHSHSNPPMNKPLKFFSCDFTRTHFQTSPADLPWFQSMSNNSAVWVQRPLLTFHPEAPGWLPQGAGM